MTSFLRRHGYTLPAVGVGLILMLVPFHAFLSVWSSQFIGHYTALRLWKEYLLVLLCVAAVYILIRHTHVRMRLMHSFVVRLMVVYIVIQGIWGLGAYGAHTVSITALGYGIVSDTRYFLFFLAVLIITNGVPALRMQWQRFVFWPLAIVVIFGLLQYFVLPYDVMRHFGYTSTTIFPYEDINSNLRYLRIMSTLRGANPLGAYLVVTLSLLGAWRQPRRWWWYVLLAGSVIALVLTFSRGAWLGLVASMVVLVAAYLRRRRIHKRVIVGLVLVGIVLVGAVGILYRTTTFQNVFLHTQVHSAVKTTSDQGHKTALQHGVQDVLHQPFGRGPGTAGPASVYNTGHPARIAENYFIQIIQETGWVGGLLFIAIICTVGVMLWRRHDVLTLGLCAGLVGVSVVNLLSHAWADDTLAYLWWGLAAIALAPAILQTKAEQSYGTILQTKHHTAD